MKQSSTTKKSGNAKAAPQATPGDVVATAKAEARSLRDTAGQRLADETEKGKQKVADELRGVSATLRGDRQSEGEATGLADELLNKTAAFIDDNARSLDELSADEAVAHARSFARDNPFLFITGCAVAGFAAARLFRADPA